SAPGTVPRTVSAILEMCGPPSVSKVTVADVSSRSGGVPALVRMFDSAIEKQAEWAAAMSSSGLVCPPDSPVRDGHDPGRSLASPELLKVVVPLPENRSPVQTVVALRSVAMVGPFGQRQVLR